ncbi:P-loop containing nucleoside triphosphate hydrolase protein [Blyttiomyces helicus]|uniref:P-loop containing nucleoside triphosphate hydrolase protein n=1 Tax=Blyttiomyces helicus TaxID=388810 RepID=A0A4P9WSR5_9FUNG|nr:P-loop containing nucleoside triphosphate hydrolase protein [Blyttiomyces helicus]|eukprot:RKO94350.1 P-loop containing nucleoside triphosphate hydrolase protein [Blyttiomyces helicus]
MTKDIHEARAVMKKIWGFDDFKPGQTTVVERILQNKSTCAIFPTGAGKSLCYRLPALCDKEATDGKYNLALIIAPLIALMKDQVDGFKKHGIAAASLDSSLTAKEANILMEQVINGKIWILLVNEKFIELLQELHISLFAVDEAHYISEPGPRISPRISDARTIRKRMQGRARPTPHATATPEVSADICKAFDIPDEGLIRTGSFRPYQEIGRAGRDGLRSNCTLLFCLQDRRSLEKFIDLEIPTFASIRSLINEMFQPGAREGDIVTKRLDLSFTPIYATFNLMSRGGFCLADQTGSVGIAIKRAAKVVDELAVIDVDLAAKLADVERAKVISLLQRWKCSGEVELYPSDVRQRHRLLCDRPSKAELHEITAEIMRRAEEREKVEIERLHGVIEWATSGATCLARSLADHFGDAAIVPPEGCGCCSWCVMPGPRTEPRAERKRAHDGGAVDEERIAAVLTAVLAFEATRDDPRLLALFAFGVISPRIKALSLHNHTMFGSMNDHEFPVLLEWFQEEWRAKRGRWE